MAPCGAEQRSGARARARCIAQAQWMGLKLRGWEETVVRYKNKAMIVAPQPEATEAGADVLREGGNAVDAGIACALVQGVVDPLMCGIAGFGSCGIYMPGQKFHGYIDAHAPAPLAARPDMWANLIESEARDG